MRSFKLSSLEVRSGLEGSLAKLALLELAAPVPPTGDTGGRRDDDDESRSEVDLEVRPLAGRRLPLLSPLPREVLGRTRILALFGDR